MERDFMGLNSNKDSHVVKEETVELHKDSGGVPWSLPNKLPAPHFMPFMKREQEDAPPRFKPDPLVSSGYMGKPALGLFDASLKQQSGGNQNFGGATMKQQFFDGIPVTAPHSIFPSTAAMAVGQTTPWLNAKASPAPAQLTIFYAGTVNVFDGIPPEKAQAIMFLAGSGFVQSNAAQPRVHGQASIMPKCVVADRPIMTTPPSISSPMSVSSHPSDQSSGTDTKSENMKVATTLGISTNLVAKVEPPRMVTPLGSVAATAMVSSAVPQARKASLARFLEKRKERVMNSTPYNLSKKAGDCATPESAGFGFSATSVVGSSPLSTSKETSAGI